MKLSITLAYIFQNIQIDFFLIFAEHFIKFHPEFLFKQRLLLGQLPFLIYIDDFRDNVSIIFGVFAEDISSFLEVFHHKVCFKNLKCDLDVVGLCLFNQDPGKQVIKVYFQRRNKLNKIISDKQLMSHNTPGNLNIVSKNKKRITGWQK